MKDLPSSISYFIKQHCEDVNPCFSLLLGSLKLLGSVGSSPVGYLRRAKVAKVTYHILPGCLSYRAALCIPRRNGRSFRRVNRAGHLTDGPIPDWVAGCSHVRLSSSSLPRGSEQPLVSYGC